MTEKQDIVLDEWNEVVATALPKSEQDALKQYVDAQNQVKGMIKAHIDKLLPEGFEAIVSVKFRWGNVQVSYCVKRRKETSGSKGQPLPTQKLRVLGE